LRSSVRYGKEAAKSRVYPGKGYFSHADKPGSMYAESVSIDGIDLNEEFKYLPDDSVTRSPTTPGSEVHKLCTHSISSSLFV